MKFFRWLWRRLTCRHAFVWQRNYYGDVIQYSGGMRSAWRCGACGKVEERKTLGQP